MIQSQPAESSTFVRAEKRAYPQQKKKTPNTSILLCRRSRTYTMHGTGIHFSRIKREQRVFQKAIKNRKTAYTKYTRASRSVDGKQPSGGE